MSRRIAVPALVVILLALVNPNPAEAQLSRIRRAAEGAVQRKAEEKISTAIGEAVACKIGDTACAEKARSDGDKVVFVDDDGQVVTDESGNPITDAAAAEATTQKPGEGRWASYDFLRGERPIYNSRWNVEDTENLPALKPSPSVRVGRIPGNVDFVTGNMQIVQIDGLNTMEFRERTVFRIPLSEPLPEDFSLELTLQISAGGQYVYVYFEPIEGQDIQLASYPSNYFELWHSGGITFQRNRVSGTDQQDFITQLAPVKFQVDDGYAILYVNGERVAQLPNFKAPIGSSVIEIDVNASNTLPAWIRDIRVDYGVEDPVSVFEAEGEYTTRSIYFDFNSADLRPESTPELERLRAMVADYGKPLVIEGHTDSVGSDDYNMDLSKRRAEAVKAYLVSKGIDAGLIEAVGKGETEPIADNGTDEGRQANRRVRVAVAGG